MRWSWKYAFITGIILMVEVLIALFVHDRFVRPFVGDLLVVMLLYVGFRTILKSPPSKVALGVLLFAVGIEIMQYFQLAKLLGLESYTWARVVLGSTFDWWDILAYFLGVGLVFMLDNRTPKKATN